MSVQTCVGCSTRYAEDLAACPHCGGTEYERDGAVVSTRRLPLLVSVSCACGRGPWQFRLPQVLTGLVQVPALFCASCGRQVQVPWPPVEDDMTPKITRSGGPSNTRDSGPSPAALASESPVGAEADRGHSSPEAELVAEVEPEAAQFDEPVLDEVQDETVEEEPVDYDSMTLAELKAAADDKGVASYGTKAQIAERLREADQEG